MVYMGYNMINLWYMCDVYMYAKKIKKKLRNSDFSSDSSDTGDTYQKNFLSA